MHGCTWNRYKILSLCLLPMIVFFSTSKSRAQFQAGPVASALGGAGRAALLDNNESSEMNPALVAYLQNYNIEARYFKGDHPRDGTEQGFAVMASDGSEGRLFPGSLRFAQVDREPITGQSPSSRNQDIQFAGGSLLVPGFAYGISVHRLLIKAADDTYTQYNGNIGVIFAPEPMFAFAFVMYDIWPAPDEIPIPYRAVPTFAFGSMFAPLPTFQFRFDAVRPDKYNPDRKADFEVGLQIMMRPEIALRLGWKWQETATPEQQWLTAGLGMKGPRLSMNYSFQKDTRVAGGTRHMFDLWLPF